MDFIPTTRATRAACSALALLAMGACASAPLPPSFDGPADGARGVVFDDRNGNGRRDRGEAGIPGVAVSDGRQVVRTAADGSWVLPRHDDTIYFAVKPRDWQPPLSENGHPRFYYLHKPAGSPPLRAGGIAATGPLPASVDFPLHRRPESERFEAILIADPQVNSLAKIDYFAQDVMMELQGSQAAFGIHLGDLVGDDPALFGPLSQATALAGVPWYAALGNHDVDVDAGDDRSADDSFEAFYGPTTFAFQIASVHFIVLDNVRWFGEQAQGDRPLPYEGGIEEASFTFLENYLAGVPRDERIVLFMHIPLVGSPRHQLPRSERERLFDILAGHPLSFSVSGHTHIQQHWFLGEEHGNRGPVHHHLNNATAAGSWWRGALDEQGIPHTTMRCGAPNGYSIASFDGNRYAVRFKAARRPADHQINVIGPQSTSRDRLASTEILANVFAGSERSRVEMRVAGGPWRRMERTERPDPLYEALRGREEAIWGSSWRTSPAPLPSPHLWRAFLPEDLVAGTTVLIEVRARDLFGRVDFGRRAMRIE